MFKIVALYAAVGTINAYPAWAYIDPGVGSIVVQAIIGSLVTAVALIGIYYEKVKTILRSILKNFTKRDD